MQGVVSWQIPQAPRQSTNIQTQGSNTFRIKRDKTTLHMLLGEDIMTKEKLTNQTPPFPYLIELAAPIHPQPSTGTYHYTALKTVILP